ncbi:unnamed protein product, partial [marine sediment metagenome]
MANTPVVVEWFSGQAALLRVKLIDPEDDSVILEPVEPTPYTNEIGSYYVTYSG